ncbi:3-hydroxyacyl-CoA dehyrogenase [Xylogone sp. PMI_703]|nr:3-hydroxyacyl-CoA dehyrogenase [Xylogone sp. PMI_703]
MASIQKAITILGAGVQGTRLAYMWSRCGRPVYLIDKSQDQLDRAGNGIQTLRSQGSFLGSSSSQEWGLVTYAPSNGLKDALSKSWLAIENVPESLILKRSVIQELDSIADPETIIASNSSSYTIEEILHDLAVRSQDRFVSLHSYWPPETPAIEIMGSEKTRPDIITLLKTETKMHGFEPFHVRVSSTGYIYNRIWAAIKREALFTLAEGVATPEEIDRIFKSVLKTPKGPFEQMDVVGLDTVLNIENHYAEVRTGLPEEPRELLKEMVAQGKLGVKSGSGFYNYPEKSD